MSRISLGGLVTGLDTDGLLDRILQAQQQRITTQNDRKKQLDEKKSAWMEVRTSLTALRTKLDALRLGGTYRGRAATISDEATAAVTVSAGATLTTHRLRVTALAQAHSIAGGSDATSPEEALNLAGSFRLKVGETEKTVTVSGADSLTAVRDSIRTQAGELVSVEAVKVQVAVGDPPANEDRYRLVLTSKTSGTAGAIVLTEDTEGILQHTTGLGFFTEGTAGIPVDQVILEAQNAAFSLNGADYDQAGNTASDLIPGLSITLLKADNVERTITVGQSLNGTVDSVQAWASALNESLDLLRAKTAYKAADGKPAVLAVDPLARQLLTGLRGLTASRVTSQPAGFDSLSAVGITSGAYGTADFGRLLVDGDVLRAKMAENEEAVAKLFGALRTNVAVNRINASASYFASSAEEPAETYGADTAFNEITAASRFDQVGGGWKSAVAPSVSPQYLAVNLGATRAVDQVRLFLPENVTVSGLRSFFIQYSTDSTDGMDGTWKTLESVADNTATLRVFDFTSVQAKWIRLYATETYGEENPASVLEMQVHEATNAPGLAMYNYVNGSLKSFYGTVPARDTALAAQIREIDDRMERMLDRLDKQEVRLRQRFARMEEAVARLQSQGGTLMNQMLGMLTQRG